MILNTPKVFKMCRPSNVVNRELEDNCVLPKVGQLVTNGVQVPLNQNECQCILIQITINRKNRLKYTINLKT